MAHPVRREQSAFSPCSDAALQPPSTPEIDRSDPQMVTCNDTLKACGTSGMCRKRLDVCRAAWTSQTILRTIDIRAASCKGQEHSESSIHPIPKPVLQKQIQRSKLNEFSLSRGLLGKFTISQWAPRLNGPLGPQIHSVRNHVLRIQDDEPMLPPALEVQDFTLHPRLQDSRGLLALKIHEFTLSLLSSQETWSFRERESSQGGQHLLRCVA